MAGSKASVANEPHEWQLDSEKYERSVVNRRRFLCAGLQLAALSAAPSLLISPPSQARAASASHTAAIHQKASKTLQETLPQIGLGTFLTFDLLPGDTRTNLLEVVRRFWDAGGRVVDTSPLYGLGEVNVGDCASTLGINHDLFIANKIWATGRFLGDDEDARASLELSLQRLWRKQIDVMQCHSLVNIDVIVPLLKQMKREQLVRYTGVSHHEVPYFAPLAQWIEQGELDVVQVHYSMHTREAEQRILPAALERGMAVLVNMPFEKARLFELVRSRTLPDFAKEIEVCNWAQFFLKWVISHPAVTCALPATSNPEHLTQNMGALHGPLPDREMRARMLRFMEAIPGFDKVRQMPIYPGKTYSGVIRRAQQRLSSSSGSDRR